MATLAAQTLPGVGWWEMFWEVPFALLGFLVMQERRQAGVKGIGRPEKSDKLWREWKKTRPELTKKK